MRTQGNPQGGVAAMRKVAEIDHVLLVLSVYTNIVTAQIPLATDLKMPTLTTTEAPGLMANAPYSFAHAATFGAYLPLLQRYWKANGVKTNGRGGERLRDVFANIKGLPSVLGGTITMGPDHQTDITAVGLWRLHNGELSRVPGF